MPVCLIFVLFFNGAAPHISAVNFPSNAGGLLNINGSNFGQAGTNISVLLGGIPCDNVTLVSDSYVTCVAPIGVGYFTVTLATPSDALHAQVASFKSHYVSMFNFTLYFFLL